MKNELRRALQELTHPGDTVVCALSGGADSVAMTHAVVALSRELSLHAAACHFNHTLRGESSDGDEAFCRDFCRELDIPFFCGRGDTRRRMEQTGESLEEAARNLRYAFFARQNGRVATAHTADDNAETLLLNLVRGTGLKGLCGIPAARDRLIRPMLNITRAQVLAYLEENGLRHRKDASNDENICLRNRLRHQVLPILKEENPNLPEKLSQMTRNLRQDEQYLQALADALLVQESVGTLAAAPECLRRRAIRTLLHEVRRLSAAHLQAVETVLLSDSPSGQVSLPDGLIFCRAYDRFFLTRSDVPTFAPVTLPCPGSVHIPELGLTFTAAAPGSPITIRPRKPGDSIVLSGGTKSLKKLMIDKKIPLRERESIPILEQDGKILSVWGVAACAGKDLHGIGAEKE